MGTCLQDWTGPSSGCIFTMNIHWKPALIVLNMSPRSKSPILQWLKIQTAAWPSIQLSTLGWLWGAPRKTVPLKTHPMLRSMPICASILKHFVVDIVAKRIQTHLNFIGIQPWFMVTSKTLLLFLSHIHYFCVRKVLREILEPINFTYNSQEKKSREFWKEKFANMYSLSNFFFIKESTKKEDFLASLDFSFMFFFWARYLRNLWVASRMKC